MKPLQKLKVPLLQRSSKSNHLIYVFMDYLKSSSIAVLIDGENIATSDIGAIFEYIRPYGSITLARVYGDFSLPHMGGWKAVVEQHAMVAVHQYGWVKGKNAADMAIVIDAMDLLHSPPNGVVLEGFCLVSSDSDFTPLALRMRQAGRLVLGCGRATTSTALRRACHHFKVLDTPTTSTAPTQPTPPAATPVKAAKNTSSLPAKAPASLVSQIPATLPADLLQAMRAAFSAIKKRPDGWANADAFRTRLNTNHRQFRPETYGVKNWTDLLPKFPAIFKVHQDNSKSPKNPVPLMKMVDDLMIFDPKDIEKAIAWSFKQSVQSDGWSRVDLFGTNLKKHCADFSYATYGAKNLSEFLEKRSDIFETRKEYHADGIHYTLYLRLHKKQKIISLPAPASNQTEHQILIGDTHFYLREYGNPYGFALLLLHGGLGSGHDFDPILSGLPQQLRILNMDLRGHGRSSRGTATLSYTQHMRDVLAVLDALNIERTAILGYSDGGITAYRLAAQHPKRVSALITLGAQWRLGVDDLSISVLGALTRADCQRLFGTSITHYEADNPAPDFERLFADVRAQWLYRGASGYPGNDPDIDWSAVRVPTLVVRGEHDPFFSRSEALALCAQNPAFFSLFQIEAVSHNAHEVAPTAFLRCIQDFLKQHSSSYLLQ